MHWWEFQKIIGICSFIVCRNTLMSDLLNITMELLVSNRQGVEELLQADGAALLPRLWWPLHQVAFLVKHQLGPHLAGLMACQHTKIARAEEQEGVLADEVTDNKALFLSISVAVEVFYLRAHKELRASPLKPNVSTWMRSEKSLSFDVWCFSAVDKSESLTSPQKTDFY